MSVIHYSCESFEEDINVVRDYIRAWGRKPYFVGLYKSSTPIAIKLSNIFNSEYSIIDVDKENDEISFLIDKIPNKASMLIVLDDILSTGETLGIVDSFLTNCGYTNKTYISIFNNSRAIKLDDFELKVSTLRVSNGEKIIFPWS